MLNNNVLRRSLLPLVLTGSIASQDCSFVTSLVSELWDTTHRKPEQNTVQAHRYPAELADTLFKVGFRECVDLRVYDNDIMNANHLEIKINSIDPPRKQNNEPFDDLRLKSVEAYPINVITNKGIYPMGDHLVITNGICVKAFGLAVEGTYAVNYSIVYSRDGKSKSFSNKISVYR